MPIRYRYRVLGITEKIEGFLIESFVRDDKKPTKKKTIIFIVDAFRFLILFILFLLTLNVTGHYYDLPLGTYGDFFGGLLNPFLTFASLLALIVTVAMQGIQLNDARNESIMNSLTIRKQGFEGSFFNMLDLHNKIVVDLNFDIQTLKATWNSEMAYSLNSKISVEGRAVAKGREVFDEVLFFLDVVHKKSFNSIDAYAMLQKKHNDVLGHYFRNLYQILNFIDRTAEELSENFDAYFYSNLLRAQLSANQLRLLLYNCSEDMVDYGAFRRLLKKYRFLEHLPLSFDEKSQSLISLQNARCDVMLYNQYLGYQVIYKQGRETSGAFGKNDAVTRYVNSRAKTQH